MSDKQFITFHIDDDLYGLDIAVVKEINKVLEITSVPRAKKYIRGMINLRGQIVTVFDMGVILGADPTEITPDSSNIILKSIKVSDNPEHFSGLAFFSGDDIAGLLVDALGDVVSIPEEEINMALPNVSDVQSKLISCVLQMQDELVTVLNPEAILKGEILNNKE
ncbi:MAG: chemotaxis protein CheW [Planctomycetota bacterium]